jgi:putative flippase GtrA
LRVASRFGPAVPQKRASEFLLFLLVGALTTVVYIGLFALLTEVVVVNHRVAITIAYPVAVGFHYLMNYHVTFRPRGVAVTGGVYRYLVLVLINFLISVAVLELVVQLAGLPPVVGAIASIGATVIASYLLSKHWVFADRGPAGESRKSTSRQ